jgi:glycosyltransferase involved in cell wall biosynthesis
MKVLTVIENIDIETGGGASERARQISLKLHNLGHDSKILTTSIHYSELTRSTLQHLTVVTLRSLYRRFWVPHPRFFLIKGLIKNSDVVHIVNHWTLLGLLSFFFCKIYKKPYFVSPLGSLVIFGRSIIFKKIYNFIIGKKIIVSSEGCIVATLEEVNQLDELNIYPKEIFHIPNGVEEDDYTFDPLGKDYDELRTGIDYILFLGRLNKIKGPDILLKAFNIIASEKKDLDLVFAGPDDGMRTELESEASKNNLQSRTHFLGYVAGEKKAKLIAESLFMVIPSRKEAMSIVVLEAGIMSRPAVLTNVCGFNEVQDIDGGIVVEPNVESIYHGIKLLLNNRSELSSMGKRLETLVRDKYLWSSAALQHEKIFKSAVESMNTNHS